MTVCQASRSGNGPLVAVAGSQRAASAVIHTGTRHDKRLPTGIANSKGRCFLESSLGFGHRSANPGLAPLGEAKGRARKALFRWSTPECVLNTASRIVFELPGVRVQ